MSNEPQREMTFEEWLDRLPRFHRVHKDFENLIAQAREEGRREAAAEIARKDELIKKAADTLDLAWLELSRVADKIREDDHTVDSTDEVAKLCKDLSAELEEKQ